MGTEERTIGFALANIVLWVLVLVVGAFNGVTGLGQFMTVIGFIAALTSLVWVAIEDRARYRRQDRVEWDDLDEDWQ